MMNEKRYFKIEYDEEWYLFDSTTISEQLVKEQAEYGYGVFANSLSPSEVVDLLNKQQSTINRLEEENDNMNLFIKQTIEPLLFNCVFELDTIESMSQVELARKIEDEIIPFIQDFKYLKYESPEEEKQDKSE